MPFDDATFDQKDEITILTEMERLLPHVAISHTFWGKGVLRRDNQICWYGALNLVDHGHYKFLTKHGVTEGISFPAWRWRFKNPAAYRVRKRLNELTRPLLPWRWRLLPRFFADSTMTYNDIKGTTHADIMKLIATAKRSFLDERVLVYQN